MVRPLGRPLARRAVTLDDLREEFLAHCEARNLSPRTLEWYADRTRRFTDWCVDREIAEPSDRVEDLALDVALVGLLIGPEVQTSVRVRLRVPEPRLSGDLLDERPDDCVFGPAQEARDGDARRIRSDGQESLDRRT